MKIKFKTEGEENKRSRKIKIKWFNSTYCNTVKTNIGKKFH